MEETEIVEKFSLMDVTGKPAREPVSDKLAAIGKIATGSESTCVQEETVSPEKSPICKGDTVIHKRYGRGKVVAAEATVLTIVFAEAGMKLFDRGWIEANCEIIQE